MNENIIDLTPGLGINNLSREEQHIRKVVMDHAAARATRIFLSIPQDAWLEYRFKAALRFIAENN